MMKADISFQRTALVAGIVLLSFVLHICAAFFSEGRAHPDSDYQILEFAHSKIDTGTSRTLPWEFFDQIRPAVQPTIGLCGAPLCLGPGSLQHGLGVAAYLCDVGIFQYLAVVRARSSLVVPRVGENHVGFVHRNVLAAAFFERPFCLGDLGRGFSLSRYIADTGRLR